MHKLIVLLNKVSPFYYKIKQVVHEVGMKSIEEQWVRNGPGQIPLASVRSS